MTQHTAHSTQHTAHSTQHTAHSTQHTRVSSIQFAIESLRNKFCLPALHSTSSSHARRVNYFPFSLLVTSITRKLTLGLILLGWFSTAVCAAEPCKPEGGSSKNLNLSPIACIQDTKDWHLVDTESPGYFDVGAGFAQIDTAGSAHAAASGVLLSIKAYPWGRWYAPRKKISTESVLEKVQKNLDLQQKSINANSLTPSADTPITTDEKAKAEYEYLEAVRNTLAKSTELMPLHGREWYHRLSVFYGRSPGNFNETAIKGAVNAIGIGFDIAPEFALFVGKAYYQEDIPGGAETRQHLIFGVQMNFNAFSLFRN